MSPVIIWRTLFSYAKKPWKTQKRVRQILETMYTTDPDGLSGNEDCGQMSAWYVFSAMGFYPVTPADSFYVLGAPVFEKITLKAGEDPFIIEADHPQKPYVKRLTMKSKTLEKRFYLP
ncbi:MAG: glycoside hydrolase family 92 protein [Bacteroidales bacterium]|nr:glycoside hydrolase family 92 protein [Bacteroidales bacterium]